MNEFFRRYKFAPLFVLGGLMIAFSHAMREEWLRIIPGLLITAAGVGMMITRSRD